MKSKLEPSSPSIIAQFLDVLKNSPSLVTLMSVAAVSVVTVGKWSLLVSAVTFFILYGPLRTRLDLMVAGWEAAEKKDTPVRSGFSETEIGAKQPDRG